MMTLYLICAIGLAKVVAERGARWSSAIRVEERRWSGMVGGDRRWVMRADLWPRGLV